MKGSEERNDGFNEFIQIPEIVDSDKQTDDQRENDTEIFENLGLHFSGKFITVDDLMRTNVEGIFAAGDIVTPYQLATVAAAQGALAAHGAYLFIRDPYWKQEHLKEQGDVKRQIL